MADNSASDKHHQYDKVFEEPGWMNVSKHMAALDGRINAHQFAATSLVGITERSVLKAAMGMNKLASATLTTGFAEKLKELEESMSASRRVASLAGISESGVLKAAMGMNKLASATLTTDFAERFKELEESMGARRQAALLAGITENSALKTAMDMNKLASATLTTGIAERFKELEESMSASRLAASPTFFSENGTLASLATRMAHHSVGGLLIPLNKIPSHSLLGLISSATDTASKLSDSYQQIIRSYGMQNLADHLSSFEWPDEVTVNEDDTVTIDESTIGGEIVRQAVIEVSDTATQNRLKNLELVLEEFIKNQPNPLVQQIVIPFIISFIILVLTPIADFYIKAQLEGNNTQDQQIKNTTKTEVYLIIARKSLAVRSSPSRKAKSIGQLSTNQVVVLNDERDDWTLVTWSDKDNNLSLQGWVLSKYLRRLQ